MRAPARADAYVVVTPEYDFSSPAALINAIQTLFNEWAHKPMGFVSYGGVSGGLRGVEMTKQVVTGVGMMPIPQAVTIPFLARQIGEDGVFDPGEVQEKAARAMLAELARWAGALRRLRG